MSLPLVRLAVILLAALTALAAATVSPPLRVPNESDAAST